jgi:hypothetical protein
MNIQEIPVSVEGFVVIKDLTNDKILYEGRNAVHQENMSVALAQALCHGDGSFISEMWFGCGAAIISTDGTITYRKPNVTGVNADLYQPTYFRVVDETDYNRAPESADNISISHVSGTNYADTIVTATLSNTDPLKGDNEFNLYDYTNGSLEATIYDGEFEFNEIGLKTKGSNGLKSGKLLTHFIFHPVQKNAEQTIQIVYTLRVRAG